MKRIRRLTPVITSCGSSTAVAGNDMRGKRIERNMKLASDESDIHSCFFANWVVMEKRVLSAFFQDAVFERERMRKKQEIKENLVIVTRSNWTRADTYAGERSKFLWTFHTFLNFMRVLKWNWYSIDNCPENGKWEWEETANSLSPRLGLMCVVRNKRLWDKIVCTELSINQKTRDLIRNGWINLRAPKSELKLSAIWMNRKRKSGSSRSVRRPFLISLEMEHLIEFTQQNVNFWRNVWDMWVFISLINRCKTSTLTWNTSHSYRLGNWAEWAITPSITPNTATWSDSELSPNHTMWVIDRWSISLRTLVDKRTPLRQLYLCNWSFIQWPHFQFSTVIHYHVAVNGEFNC